MKFITLKENLKDGVLLVEKNTGRKIGTITFLSVQLTLREFSEFIQINVPESILENAFPE